MKRTSDRTYRANRATLLEGNPNCALCGKPGADTADHIIPYDAGGSDDLDNLRPAHQKCNSRAGAQYLNAKRTIQQHQRNEAMAHHETNLSNLFLIEESTSPDRKSVV